MNRDDILANMDDDVDRLTIRALQAEAAGMPGSGEGLLKCAEFIERMAAAERASPRPQSAAVSPAVLVIGDRTLDYGDGDVLVVSEQHLGGVRLR